ncbi:ABC-2 family transporter permease [Vallitalea okinawensis]|uniref:hypothetical protein n=1 Tax=Vallitalea okinawensis TaxID=2078660 RepID=UPI000CFE3270|nr:hypothetical protein [Vallitalea okinawensis]
MNDYFYLRVLDRFQGLFEKQGICYKSLRQILQLKLTMDARRQTTMTTNRKKDSRSFFSKSLLTHGLMGFMLLIFIIPDIDLFFQMNVCLGIIIFMLMSSLIADFSSVLLDQKDKSVLLTKPIEPSVISLAKILHIIYYVGILLFIMSIAPLIGGTFKYGLIYGLLFIVTLVLGLLFVMFLTTLLYFLILKFFDGEKLKDIINYFQIVLTIVMIFGYQLMSRMYTIIDFDMVFEPKWWTYLIPSAWFASYFRIFVENQVSTSLVVLAMLGILVPITAIIVHVKYVMPYFEGYLNKMEQVGGVKKHSPIKERLNTMLQLLLCPSKEERTFFKFFIALMKHERKLKLRIIPQLVMALGFPFIFMINSGFDVSESSKAFMFIYFSFWMMSFLFTNFLYSENYKGAWVYKSLPIQDINAIRRALYKSAMSNYIVPVYVGLSVIFLFIYNFTIFGHLALMFLNLLIITMLLFRISINTHPFSMEMDIQKGDSKSFILGTLIIGIVAGIHWLSTIFSYGLYINIFMTLLITVALWIILFRKRKK